MYFVYILFGKKYYVGYTYNIERRLAEHRAGKVKSTKHYESIELMGWYPCESKKEALELESRIKRSKNIQKRIGREWFVTHNSPSR